MGAMLVHYRDFHVHGNKNHDNLFEEHEGGDVIAEDFYERHGDGDGDVDGKDIELANCNSGEEQGGGGRSASPSRGRRVRHGTQLCHTGNHRHHMFIILRE